VRDRKRACQRMIGRWWLRLGLYGRPEAVVLRVAMRPFKSIPQSGQKILVMLLRRETSGRGN
jgi:hypothetical protein